MLCSKSSILEPSPESCLRLLRRFEAFVDLERLGAALIRLADEAGRTVKEAPRGSSEGGSHEGGTALSCSETAGPVRLACAVSRARRVVGELTSR